MINLISKIKDKFPNERFSAGISISPRVVKFVKLKFLKERIDLLAYHFEQNNSDIEGILRKIFFEQTVKNINISISGQQAIVRYVDFPKMNKEDLKQAIKFEAQKYIPFPVNEVNLDGCILKNDLPNNKMRVLIAAVKKDFLNQQIKFIQSLGVVINNIEVDAVSLINSFNFNYLDDENVKGKTIALLNVGQVTSNLNIIEAGGVPALSRDIPIGRDMFIQKIADVLAVDTKSVDSGKVDLEKAKVVIDLILSKLAEEIRTSFDYYESRSVSSVEKIFITGESNLYGTTKDKLGEFLALKVISWDPLKKIIIADNLDITKINPISGELAVSVGLALREYL